MIKPAARDLHRWATAHAGEYAFLAKDADVEKPSAFHEFCREVNGLLDDPKVMGSELEDDIMEINNLSVAAQRERSMDACIDLAVAMRRAFIKRHGSRKEKQELESAGSIIARVLPMRPKNETEGDGPTDAA